MDKELEGSLGQSNPTAEESQPGWITTSEGDTCPSPCVPAACRSAAEGGEVAIDPGVLWAPPNPETRCGAARRPHVPPPRTQGCRCWRGHPTPDLHPQAAGDPRGRSNLSEPPGEVALSQQERTLLAEVCLLQSRSPAFWGLVGRA